MLKSESEVYEHRRDRHQKTSKNMSRKDHYLENYNHQ